MDRNVLFVDLDNTLYPKSFKINEMMSEKIHEYFKSQLQLSDEDAFHLHMKYYKQFGLALEGLVRNHKIDPLQYNQQVDDALPLESVLKPDPAVRALLERFDRSKVKLWVFTNAYKSHAQRVLKLLDLEDQFEGMTYCDYAEPVLVCKPKPEMFGKAMREAGAVDVARCHFIDDSHLNIEAARQYGWTRCIYLYYPDGGTGQVDNETIVSFLDVEKYFPEFIE